jgi:GNAT superfamily N-acetyltransferase
MNHAFPLPAFRDRVVPEDRLAVRRIVESTGFFRPDEVDVAVELVDERLAKGDASGYYFLFAEEADRAIGYACYGPIACTVGSYDLFWIAVDRDQQGRGLGRRLVEESERRIRDRGGRRVYVETSGRPQYLPTRQFYERCDYQTAAILPDFYDAGDDKVILVKAL